MTAVTARRLLDRYELRRKVAAEAVETGAIPVDAARLKVVRRMGFGHIGAMKEGTP